MTNKRYYSGEAGIGFTNNSHRQQAGGFHFNISFEVMFLLHFAYNFFNPFNSALSTAGIMLIA